MEFWKLIGKEYQAALRQFHSLHSKHQYCCI
jgi:hypothetical protein